MEINFFNSRSVIVFVCLLQGLVFASLLIWRGLREKSRADFWLAALLLLLCSSLITPFIGFASVYTRYRWLTYFPFSIAYTYGVVVYFYVQSLTNAKHKFSYQAFLLFIPSALYVVFRLVLFAQSLEFKNWFDDNYYVPYIGPILFVTEFFWNLFFLWLTLSHYRKYRQWLNENFSDTERVKFDWLRNFHYVFTFIFVLGSIFDFTDSFIFTLTYIQYFYFQIVLSLVTYYLAIAGYLRSATIELNFEPHTEEQNQEETIKPLAPKTPVTDADLERLKTDLQKLMRDEKPYLEPQLTLADLSRKFGINTTLLSYVINQGFGKNFNDFVNGFRVEEIKEKLQNGTAKNLNLLGVAFECGFNSKATFNRAFKKITGISPKEFQANEE